MMTYCPNTWAQSDELLSALEQLFSPKPKISFLPTTLQVLANISSLAVRVRAHAAKALRTHSLVLELAALDDVLPDGYRPDAILDDGVVELCERSKGAGLKLGELSVAIRRERLSLVNKYFFADPDTASDLLFIRLAGAEERAALAEVGQAFREWNQGTAGAEVKSMRPLDELCAEALAEVQEVVHCLGELKRCFRVTHDETTMAYLVVKDEPSPERVTTELPEPLAGPSKSRRPRASDHLPFASTTPEPRPTHGLPTRRTTPPAPVIASNVPVENSHTLPLPPPVNDDHHAVPFDGGPSTSHAAVIADARAIDPRKSKRKRTSGLPPATGPEFMAHSPGRSKNARLRPFRDDQIIKAKKSRVSGPGRPERR